MKKCISDLKDAELKGKRVLVRVDFNVPMDKQKKTSRTTCGSSRPCPRSAI